MLACLSMNVCIMMLRSAKYGWFMVIMVGVLCFSVTPSRPCRARAELMLLKVSRYVTLLSPCPGRSVVFPFRVCLPERARYCRGLCVVTSFDVRMSCSIPRVQLAHALLIRRLVVGVRGMSVS